MIPPRQKALAEACEAVLPLMFYGTSPIPIPKDRCLCAAYADVHAREDFAEVWMPTYIKLTQQWRRRLRHTHVLEDDDALSRH
jgi:hypothetical protein